MRRMQLIFGVGVVCVLGMSMAGFTATGSQTGRGSSSAEVKQVKVNARTLAKLPPGKNYVVDLTRVGSIYEFDPPAKPVDFKRVALRTSKGEEAIESRLKKALSEEELARWYSQGFHIGNVADFKSEEGLQPPIRNNSAASTAFTCDSNYCTCSGHADCWDMNHTNVCGGDFFACTHRGGGLRCICSRHI